jgi:Leucine-rich repeat (LRR) protein
MSILVYEKGSEILSNSGDLDPPRKLILTNYASSSNLNNEKGSPILSNSEKSLVINNRLHVSNYILALNKLDYLMLAKMTEGLKENRRYFNTLPIDILLSNFSENLDKIILAYPEILQRFSYSAKVRIINSLNGYTLYKYKTLGIKLEPEVNSIINERIGSFVKIKNWLNSFESIDSKTLGNLKELNLESRRISNLPAEIGNLVNLEKLILDGNQLSELPDEIDGLINLKVLSAEKCLLNRLPDTIDKLKKLKELSLANNQLKSIPDTIGELESLEILNLNLNLLESIPESINKLSSLKELHLAGNMLETLPEITLKLEKLTLGYNAFSDDEKIKIAEMGDFIVF